MDPDESFVTSDEGVLLLKKGTGGTYKGGLGDAGPILEHTKSAT